MHVPRMLYTNALVTLHIHIDAGSDGLDPVWPKLWLHPDTGCLLVYNVTSPYQRLI